MECVCKMQGGKIVELCAAHGERFREMAPAHDQLLASVKAWRDFWNDMPKEQLGRLVLDVGLLNDAFLKQRAALVAAGEKP